jgi:predicted transglutaminase-like cysteine proteinase
MQYGISQWVLGAWRAAAVAVLAVASAGLAAANEPAPPAATFMRVYGASPAPNGWGDFCSRTAKSCAKKGGSLRVVMDARRWQEVAEVNALVNRTVEPRSDLELYGVTERWTLPDKAGDCEDYGLLKQAMLVERGWPRGALLMTVVRDEQGQGHAVLTVATKSGDLVLDNRHDRIIGWQTSPYSFVKRQSTLNPKVWLALEPIDRMPPTPSASATATDGAAKVRRRLRQ